MDTNSPTDGGMPAMQNSYGARKERMRTAYSQSAAVVAATLQADLKRSGVTTLDSQPNVLASSIYMHLMVAFGQGFQAAETLHRELWLSAGLP